VIPRNNMMTKTRITNKPNRFFIGGIIS